MLKIDDCGAGGESFVKIGDKPGTYIVIKSPHKMHDIESSMAEAHMIELLCDHTGCTQYIVQPKEELIVYKEGTNQRIFYCVFYERVKTEIQQSFPDNANGK